MNYAICLSGGVGSRLGLEIPKQYYQVKGRRLIRYVLDSLSEAPSIGAFVIVADREWTQVLKKELEESRIRGFAGFAEPGENRQLSVYHGLLYLKEHCHVREEDLVLVQDAARPNTTVELIEACIRGAGDCDGAIPVLPMKDTIYRSGDGRRISSCLPREQLVAGQAPEVFRFGKYLAANERLLPREILAINGSTEPAILAGMEIAMIPGDERNYKITTKADLIRFCEEMESETE